MKIKKITKSHFSGKVYNFHCLPDENYFSQNILTHNCYKGNSKGNKATNMSFDTFKKLLNKFPQYNGEFLTQQIAFGITSVKSHPEFFQIVEYCREHNIIPNLTINGADPLTNEEIQRLVKNMGAMAISVNKYNFEQGLNLIQKIINTGGKQINIHYVVSQESIEFAYKLCEASKNDARLKNLNAIVWLSLKPKNRGEHLQILPETEFYKLIRFCLDNKIRFGADSCSGHKVLKTFTKEELNSYGNMVTPCEATQESFYCNADGYYFPCSFLENEKRDIWENGINVLEINDFVKDLWLNPSVRDFRRSVKESNSCGNNCCHFKI